MKIHFSRVSSNVKTGPIPVSTSSRETCPPTCDFKGNGCYAENFPLRIHWDRVTEGARGLEYPDFLAEIRALPKGQLWRHNQAGDLAGEGGQIDIYKLAELAAANRGRRGFSYTHYPLNTFNTTALALANMEGLTINVSADSLDQADAMYRHGLPLVAVVPPGWRGTRSPAGNPVTVCPAQARDDMTCATCQLCANSDRRAIVAFEAHGARKKTVIQIMEKK